MDNIDKRIGLIQEDGAIARHPETTAHGTPCERHAGHRPLTRHTFIVDGIGGTLVEIEELLRVYAEEKYERDWQSNEGVRGTGDVYDNLRDDAIEQSDNEAVQSDFSGNGE